MSLKFIEKGLTVMKLSTRAAAITAAALITALATPLDAAVAA